MRNLEQREGFINRHIYGLPKANCTMKVVTMDVNGEHIFTCEWIPFDKNQYTEKNIPGDGYLGTAKVIDGKFTGIGFHAFEQNNSEFVFYFNL